MAKKKRVWELDFWRGLAIILVVFDHAFFDYARIFSAWGNCGVPFLEKLNEISVSYLTGDVRFFWRPAFLFLFFCVSGICTSMSKNNFHRGVKLWCVALCISVITFIAEALGGQGTFVLFGVLHCLAAIILIYSLVDFIIRGAFFIIEKISKKPINEIIKVAVNATIMFVICAVTLYVNFKYNPRFYDVEKNYAISELDGKIFGILFFTNEWWTADYFPIFPFISFFFFGAGISKILYRKKKTLFPLLDGCWHNVFSAAGRHSLAVYLLGQVVALGMGVLLSLAFLGTTLLFS